MNYISFANFVPRYFIFYDIVNGILNLIFFQSFFASLEIQLFLHIDFEAFYLAQLIS